MRRKSKKIDSLEQLIFVSILIVIFLLASRFLPRNENNNKIIQRPELSFSMEDLPEFDEATPYVVINENIPDFEEKYFTNESFEQYSELDELGRCGIAFANIGIDIMPTEERGAIGSVKPSGWHTVRYDIVDGKYLYNRCHLIGYQLSGENANTKNLITGTRFLNTEGMLPFE